MCDAGEIIPQALCTRYGLAIGAYSAWFVRILIYTVGIISFPISKVLDYLLGEEHGVCRCPLLCLQPLHLQNRSWFIDCGPGVRQGIRCGSGHAGVPWNPSSDTLHAIIRHCSEN